MRAITLIGGRAAFRTWAALLMLVLTPPMFLLVALVPTLRGRRQVCRYASRALFFALGTRLTVTGAARIGAEPAVVVANHGSYLDGMILQGALPPVIGFVIKHEVTRVPGMHFLLRRIGSQFVDRHSAAGRLRDTRRVVRLAGAGESLGFFPEGTFDPQPGLKPFKGGAFTAAARSGLPVIPVVVHGARAMLPADRIWPRPGRLRVEVLPAIRPGDRIAETAAAELRRRARAAIAARLDEPDLDPRSPPDPPAIPVNGATDSA